MRLCDAQDVVALVTAKALDESKLQRVEPKLGCAVVSLDVDVRGARIDRPCKRRSDNRARGEWSARQYRSFYGEDYKMAVEAPNKPVHPRPLGASGGVPG